MTPIAATPTKHKQWHLYALYIIACMAGATGPSLLRMMYAEGIPAPAITAFRLLAASLALTPIVFTRYRQDVMQLSRRDILVAVTAGALFSIQFTLHFESFHFTSILVAGVISSALPLWTILIERVVQHIHFPRAVWVGLALALAGGTLIGLSPSGTTPSINENILLGGGIGLASTLVGATYLIMGRSLRHHMPFIPYLWLLFTSAAIVAVITAGLGGYSLTGYTPKGYMWMLLATLFPQIIAHGIFNYILAHFPATLVSISAQVVTVISAFAALLFFHEIPAPLQIAGSVIIIAGVSGAILAQSRNKGA